jgi:hypothetical protein
MRLPVVVVLATLTLGAHPPLTARKVVENSLAARGGAARFAAVHSLSFRGHLDLGQGNSAPLAVWMTVQPPRIRIELSLPQGKMVQGYDGKTAWMLPPGQTSVQFLAGDQARSLQDQAMSGVDLLATANTPVLVGSGSLDGHNYDKLQFTLPTGDTFVQYIDTHTWLAFHEEYPGGVEDISQYQRIGGLLLPMRFVSGPAGRPGTPLVREQMSLNPVIAPTLFSRP